MSKNIVDSVLELNDYRFGLLPTRRQIDFNSGYVNGWNTKSFYEYVKSINPNIILERDHSGPLQGSVEDFGYETYTHDANYFDVIHLDPWKYTQNHLLGIKETVDAIKYIHHINPNTKFEILTEEAIKPFSDNELISILQYLITNLTKDEFHSIIYIVIQSGVGLDLVGGKNTGIFNLEKLKTQSLLVKSFGKKTKEHNGDYLSTPELQIRFENGLDSINIGPEIAQIETLTYLDNMTSEQIDEYYQICLDSKKWERWVGEDFDFDNKRKLIQVCGHYCFGQYDLPKIDDIVKENIKRKLTYLP
jgi:hypothetical protein